jgi:hypothetical protein
MVQRCLLMVDSSFAYYFCFPVYRYAAAWLEMHMEFMARRLHVLLPM